MLPPTLVQLQERFSARAHHVLPRDIDTLRPLFVDSRRESLTVDEFASIGTVGPNKIRIAKSAHSCRAISFQSRPQITTGKPTEHGRTPRLGTFALEGVENLFNAIGHRIYTGSAGSLSPDENDAASRRLVEIDSIDLRQNVTGLVSNPAREIGTIRVIEAGQFMKRLMVKPRKYRIEDSLMSPENRWSSPLPRRARGKVKP
jgi:hypothetical protein